MASYSAQHASAAETLASFERAMEALAEVDLLPALQTDGRRTLADCVPQERLRRWAAECARSHEHFAAKARRLPGGPGRPRSPDAHARSPTLKPDHASELSPECLSLLVRSNPIRSEGLMRPTPLPLKPRAHPLIRARAPFSPPSSSGQRPRRRLHGAAVHGGGALHDHA